MVREGKKNSIRPDESWLKEKGNLADVAVPKVVAWLSMTHVDDISDDEKVKEKLKGALPEFKGFTTRNGNTLLKILKQYGVDKEAMSELGAPESAIEQLEEKAPSTESQPEDTSKVADPLASLYEGKETAEEIEKAVAKGLVSPIFKAIEKYSKPKLQIWWESIKKQGLSKDQWIEFVKNKLVSEIIQLGLSGIFKKESVLKYLN